MIRPESAPSHYGDRLILLMGIFLTFSVMSLLISMGNVPSLHKFISNRNGAIKFTCRLAGHLDETPPNAKNGEW
jgi:hypothetical protein